MRKVMFVALAVSALLLGLSLPGEARFRGGVWVGPAWGPGWWGSPYPYYPPQTIVVEQPPDVYVEPAPQPEEPAWYYCQDPKGYYPYVKQCPKGWQKVAPTPPPADRKE